MSKSLWAETPPYFVTIIVAAFAWYLNHTVDRVLASPTIVISKSIDDAACRTGSKKHKLSVRIDNISNDLFRNVRFQVQPAPNSKTILSAPQLFPAEPAWGATKELQVDNNAIVLEFDQIHPGWQYILNACLEGDDMPSILLQSADSAVKISSPGLDTFFVKHETIMLLIAIVLLASPLLSKWWMIQSRREGVGQ